MSESGKEHYLDEAESAPLTKWKQEPTVADLKKDLEESNSHHSTNKGKISDWLDNLNVEGKAVVKTPEGSSKIVPKLIRKQAEWRYAALSEPFLSTQDLFDISPVSWEDKPAALQNQLVLNNQFNTKLNKVKLIDEYVRTAVDEGTAILRTGWAFEEEAYEEEVPVLEFLVNPQMQGIHEDLVQLKAQDPAKFKQDVPEELAAAHDVFLESGEPVEAEVVGYEMVEKTRTIRNHPTVEVCDYRNVIVDPTCNGDLDKASFVIYSFESSLSELEKDGKYQNLKQINIDTNSALSEPDHHTENSDNFTFTDKPRKKFVVYEYWGYWDIDGSGVVKPVVASWVGNTMIRMEENPFPDKKLPFIIVQYLPKRKSSHGEPDGALLEDNQKIMGAVTRGMIDIMGKSANGQTGSRKDALDVTNRRKFERGQDYQYNGNVSPNEAFYMHTYPEIPQSAQFMLQLQNMEAESLTGVKSFNQGVSGASLGEVAAGVRGALDASSKREMGILRRLSQGIVEVGRKIVAMNAVFLDEEEIVRVSNEEFVPVKRDDLPGEFDLKLTISTAEEDDAKAKEGAFMLQTMGPNVDFNITKKILANIFRLRKMPDLAKDIENYEPQPDPFEQQKQQLELQLLQMQIEEVKSKIQQNYADAGLDQAKAGTEQVKAGNLQSDTDIKNLDYVEQESGVKQERELQKHGEQARSQAQLKLLDREFEKEDQQYERLRGYLKG